jgi:Holliday junction resolvase RusA-like endonuclease
MIAFTIPGEAVSKGRPRMTRAGHAFTPAKTRNAEAHVKLLAGQAMQGRAPIDVPVHVNIAIECAIPPSWPRKKHALAVLNVLRPGKPDIDNTVKLILDALNGVALVDDKLVASVSARKTFGQVPHTRVTIQVLAHAHSDAQAA